MRHIAPTKQVTTRSAGLMGGSSITTKRGSDAGAGDKPGKPFNPPLTEVHTMAWAKSTTTKHTCGGPAFGRKTPGCPRCDELLAGAAPIAQTWRKPTRNADGWYPCAIPGGSCGSMRDLGICTCGT